MSVDQRFAKLVANLQLTAPQRLDGITKHTGVRKCLNLHYYGQDSGTANSLLVGSWGKDTTIRPPRDIDVMPVLPVSVYYDYQNKFGNKQSQLLQEVRRVLARSYPTTKMRADGQVVVVPFWTYAVEVVPAFPLDNGKFYICDTHNGGSYKTVDPNAEQAAVEMADRATGGKLRHLVQMGKCWQGYCHVPVKSFWLELLAIAFLAKWEYANHGIMFYDWMIRDFLRFMLAHVNGFVFVPGTAETVPLGSAWESKARMAYGRAIRACEYEAQGKGILAGMEWQKIFGGEIPI